jgi:multiple sugar transport system ATP-binding protein
MSGLRFDHVWKMYSHQSPAVADLDLEITEGEFLILVGPSGCGKTTSLRMLAGLERPSYGRIWMGDRDVTDVPPGRRDVSMVFQSYALYPNMTVYRNLAFGPRVRRDPRQDIRTRVQEVAEILGIAELLDRHPGQLSGGQRQRVALGRAMIREPQLFLMDEPLSNLDAALRVQMRAELIRLHKRLEETTTVYVTHDQVEALTMGDRVAVLKDGSLLQVGTPTELYDSPATAYVAGFIGSPKMNLVPGQLSDSAGQWRVTCFGASFVLPWAPRPDRQAPRDVLVGIRPDDLGPAARAPQGAVKVSGLIDVCEQTGIAIYATIQTDAAQAGGAQVVAKLPRHPVPATGEPIEVAFDPHDVHLFDGETQESLLDRSTAGATPPNGELPRAASPPTG